MYFPISEQDELNKYSNINKQSIISIEDKIQKFYNNIKTHLNEINNNLLENQSIMDTEEPKLLTKPMFYLGRNINFNIEEEVESIKPKAPERTKQSDKDPELNKNLEVLIKVLVDSLKEINESRERFEKEHTYSQKYRNLKKKFQEYKNLEKNNSIDQDNDTSNTKKNINLQFGDKFQENIIHQLKREKLLMFNRIRQLEDEIEIKELQKDQLEMRLENANLLIEEKTNEIQNLLVQLKNKN